MNTILKLFTALFITTLSLSANSQDNINILTGQIDGVDITKHNILSYQIVSRLNYPVQVEVKGILFYRQSDTRIQLFFKIKSWC
jgi:hypothetical protein